jgi:hypothetical protein
MTTAEVGRPESPPSAAEQPETRTSAAEQPETGTSAAEQPETRTSAADPTPAGPTEEKPRPSSVGPPGASPLWSSAWLLRTAAFGSVFAGAMGILVAPGARGNASDPTVLLSDWLSGALAYFLLGALVALFIEATLELLRASEVPIVPRVVLVSGGALVVAISGSALRDRIPPAFALAVTAVTAVVAFAGAFCGARAPHTRAVAGVLFAFALAALVRSCAWWVAARAGDTGNVTLFAWGRALSTAGVMLEAAGQLVAVLWLSSRGRWAGQLGLTFALVLAVALTWGAAQGVHSGAAFWQSFAHSALAGAAGEQTPYRLAAFSVFLVSSSLLLALVVALQPNQVVAVTASMTLALVSRGAFDAPLRALCAATAAQWLAIAQIDGRSMWRTLLDDRARRLAD